MIANYFKYFLFLVVLVLALLPSACSAQRNIVSNHSLQNTTWQSKISDSCVNEYMFHSDSSLTYYSCETLLDYTGNYQFHNDTLIIRVKGNEGDELLPLNSDQRGIELMYKAVVKKDSLYLIELYTRVRGKWIKDDFKFEYGYLRK